MYLTLRVINVTNHWDFPYLVSGYLPALLTVLLFFSIVAAPDEDSDLEIVYVKEPTAEQAALARKLQLPLTFFCYKNELGYVSDDETDGERTKKIWMCLTGTAVV